MDIKISKEEYTMSLSVILLTILGTACVLYGIMVLLIRSGTSFFAVWLALGAFFLVLGFLMRSGLVARIPKIVRTLFLIAICAGLLLLSVCEGFVLRGFGSRAPAGLDYLIVLGAQVREDGPSAVLKYRLDAAAQYLRENGSTTCIVTGGKGATEPFSEGEGMKQYLVGVGRPEDRIIVEDNALNTVQNIQYSKALMSSPDAPTAIVTNNFHVTRALALARGQGLTNVHAIAAPSDLLFLPNNMFREFFGLTKDFLMGNF